jgi:hypothetical protein
LYNFKEFVREIGEYFQQGAHMKAEVTSIEQDGFWLLTDQGEFFVSFEDYPILQGLSVQQIFGFRENSLIIDNPGKNLKPTQNLYQPG